MDWHGTGVSVMEMSHRGKAFVSISEAADKDLRELLKIPENFKVFFFNGGASMQFAAIPCNLMKTHKKANYLVTGSWGSAACKEAKKYGEVNEVINKLDAYTGCPDSIDWNIAEDADYFHYCDNETIYGVEFNNFPFEKVPEGQTIVCDMSSNFCSREIDWSKYGVVYAGA
jgi:phosphoserine aminotransferase